MKTPVFVRSFTALLLIGAMLSPISAAAFADGGKKHFNAGMKYEVSEQWDKAAEAFALAVSENPKNPEYRLHLTRALFNASQMFIKKGSAGICIRPDKRACQVRNGPDDEAPEGRNGGGIAKEGRWR